ncbi:MAG: glycosyltransferase [Eubacterium sp.]|jgi:Uncharacterized protein conserved in bacteria|nr:glycosyltransferase [Eubacterium sp.]
MEILAYRYNSICEPDLLLAFEQSGHRVDEMTAEIEKKDISEQERMALVSGRLKKKKYDIVFTVNFFPVISEVCRIFKIPYFSWIVDSPVMELYSDSVKNEWNWIFLFDYALYEEFSALNPNHIFYMPLAVNCERVDRVVAGITWEDRKKYSADVSFVGSLYSEKSPYNRMKKTDSYLCGYLDGIIEAQLKVYGYNFLEECLTEKIINGFKEKVPFYSFPEKASHNDKAALAHLYLGNKVTELERARLLKAVSERFSLDLYTASDASALPKAHLRGLAKTMTEMPKIFHLSKINLNFTSKPIRTGIPLRVWDILGAGGFLITNYQSELPEYFEPGTDLEVYGSEEELLEKIQYYLEHEEKRAEIAKNGYQKVKQEHTVQKRVSKILELFS